MKADKLTRQRGTAIVETAITFLLFFMFIFGVLEASWFFYRQVTISNAAREAAKYAVLPLTQTDTLPTEDEVRTFVAKYLEVAKITCASSCVVLTRDNIVMCSTCSPQQISTSAHVTVTVPYQILTMSMFGLGGFNMTADSVMREEVSRY